MRRMSRQCHSVKEEEEGEDDDGDSAQHGGSDKRVEDEAPNNSAGLTKALKSLFRCTTCSSELPPPTPIYQCEDGHLLCQHCKKNPDVKVCSECSLPLDGRNLPMENIALLVFASTKELNPTALTSMLSSSSSSSSSFISPPGPSAPLRSPPASPTRAFSSLSGPSTSTSASRPSTSIQVDQPAILQPGAQLSLKRDQS